MKHFAIKLLTITSTTFFIVKILNLFVADVAFNQGYKANLQGEYEKSAELIEQAVKLNKHEAEYYYELADSYCMLQRYEQCLQAAEKALQLNQQNILTLKSLTRTFARVGLVQNAKLMSERLLQLSPTDEESRQLNSYIIENLLPQQTTQSN